MTNKNSNPIQKAKSIKNLTTFLEKFNQFFDNEKIDAIVNQEFNQKYELLPLLVKARIYYNEH